MDTRMMLENLEKRYAELKEEHDNMNPEDIKAYLSYASMDEAVRKEMMNPDVYEKCVRHEELETVTIPAFEKEVSKLALELVQTLTEQVAEVKEKIAQKEKLLEGLSKEIDDKKARIAEFEGKPDFDKNEEAKFEVEKLKAELSGLEPLRENKQRELSEQKVELGKAETELEENKEKYNIVMSYSRGKSRGDEDPSKKGKDEDSSKKEKDDDKSKGGSSGVGGTGTPETEKKLTEKEKFDGIYSKIKSGKELKDEEVDVLLAIMSDKSKYNEYDITSGVIFNKSRKIFKSLARKQKEESIALKAEARGVFDEKPMKANEKLNVIRDENISSWDELKAIGKDTERLTVSERYFKRLMEKKRDLLEENQQNVFDKLPKLVGRMNKLKMALAAYTEVAHERKSERFSFATKMETAPLKLDEHIDASPVETPPAKLNMDEISKVKTDEEILETKYPPKSTEKPIEKTEV